MFCFIFIIYLESSDSLLYRHLGTNPGCYHDEPLLNNGLDTKMIDGDEFSLLRTDPIATTFIIRSLQDTLKKHSAESPIERANKRARISTQSIGDTVGNNVNTPFRISGDPTYTTSVLNQDRSLSEPEIQYRMTERARILGKSTAKCIISTDTDIDLEDVYIHRAGACAFNGRIVALCVSITTPLSSPQQSSLQKKLLQLHASGYTIVAFIKDDPTKTNITPFKQQCESISASFAPVPIIVVLPKNKFSALPLNCSWKDLASVYGMDVMMHDCMVVGSDAGRIKTATQQKDKSAKDRKFAANIALDMRFEVPEHLLVAVI
jgi:hypothetical protein